MHAVIFVTDDEQAIRSSITKRLTRQGHHVVGYESGEALPLADIERMIIDEVLRLASYNKTLVAKQLGLTRFSLDRRPHGPLWGRGCAAHPQTGRGLHRRAR